MFLKVFFNIGYIFYNFSFSFMSPVCHICMTLRGLRHSLKDVTKSRWKSNKRFVVVLVLISFTKGVALSVLLYWLKFQGKQTISDNFFFTVLQIQTLIIFIYSFIALLCQCISCENASWIDNQELRRLVQQTVMFKSLINFILLI